MTDDRAGDAACWLDHVCELCGGFIEDARDHVCRQPVGAADTDLPPDGSSDASTS